VAHAPDGTIEGVEMPGCPWCIAVQWHPEITAAEDPIQQRLFDALVRQARGGGERGSRGVGETKLETKNLKLVFNGEPK